MKFLKILSLAFILTAASTNWVFAQDQIVELPDSTETMIVKVKGADCAHDLQRMVLNVEKEAGVSHCKVVKEGVVAHFEVAFNPTLVTRKAINAAFENTSGCANPDNKPYRVKNK